MNCPHCGAENDATAVACFTCGEALSTVSTIRQGSLIASRYEIRKTLGKGGMGMVYRAHDRLLQEEVAIKVLRPEIAADPDVARRFVQEIKLARKVRHRNVCGIHEYGEAGAIRFIAMEFIDGVDLRKVLNDQGAPPAAEAFDVVIAVAEGLQAIHEAGIIHRDLKTPNIMRDAEGRIRLMDFGIAKKHGADATQGATALGMVVGTPEYMSPEQARGEKIDFRSDVYALGIVVFEIFTGSVPFRGDTPIATLLMHIQEPPPLTGPGAPPLPAELVPVLAKALAKRRDERYESVSDMLAALREAQTTAVVEAPPRPVRGSTALQPDPEPVAAIEPTPVPTSVPTSMPTAVPTGLRPPVPAAAESRPPADEAARAPEESRPAATSPATEPTPRPETPPARPARRRKSIAPEPTGPTVAVVGADATRAVTASAKPPPVSVLARVAPSRPPRRIVAIAASASLVVAGVLAWRVWSAKPAAVKVPDSSEVVTSPSPEDATKVQPPASPAPRPVATGALVIDARPWGEVISIVDAKGSEHVEGSDRWTPYYVNLSAGEYRVTVSNPAAANPVVVTVSVVAAQTRTQSVEFRKIDADEYFKRIGL